MNPHRPKLAETVAREIKQDIESGRWREWLPQERLFAEDLKTSRSTLRKALAILRGEGMIEAHHSKGNRILSRHPGENPQPISTAKSVIMLSPGDTGYRRELVAIEFDSLQRELARDNIRLQIIEAKACYSEHPEKALSRITKQHSCDCWLLRLSNRPMQQWFQRHQLPCVVLGGRFSGVHLPFIDINWRSLAHHAVGVLTRKGHRQLALVVGRRTQPGDMENIAGYHEAIKQSSMTHPEIRGVVIHFEDNMDEKVRQLHGLIEEHEITALLLSQPAYYLMALSELAQMGLRVPHDISLLAQIGSDYLSNIIPLPARYSVNRKRFNKITISYILSILRKEVFLDYEHVILPDYMVGKSVRDI